jgi:hypothetical protein
VIEKIKNCALYSRHARVRRSSSSYTLP